MLQNEFFERTGVIVSTAEFEQIHEQYLLSDMDKDTFCAHWAKANAYRVHEAKVYQKLNEHRQKLSWVARDAYDKLFDYPDKNYPAIVVLTLKEMKAIEDCGVHLFYSSYERKPKRVSTITYELHEKFGW